MLRRCFRFQSCAFKVCKICLNKSVELSATWKNMEWMNYHSVFPKIIYLKRLIIFRVMKSLRKFRILVRFSIKMSLNCFLFSKLLIICISLYLFTNSLLSDLKIFVTFTYKYLIFTQFKTLLWFQIAKRIMFQWSRQIIIKLHPRYLRYYYLAC